MQKTIVKRKKDVLMDDEFLLTHGMSNDMEQVLDKMFIDSAISSLSKELKEVVVLYYLDGFKIAEIAEKLQISLSLAKVPINKCTKTIGNFWKRRTYMKRNFEMFEVDTWIEPNEEKLWDTVNKSIEIFLFERAGKSY